MPHSSGGGSHGGGFHSGHSFSSGRSGTRSPAYTYPTVSHRYRPGYHRYVYYRNHSPVYFYSSRDIREKDTKPQTGALVGYGVMMLFGILIFFLFLGDSFSAPQKLSPYRDMAIRVEDSANLLSDADEALLKDTFTEFQNLTGITPAIVTLTPNEWQGRYRNLELYAYDAYVNRFSDEKHWLFCYAGDPDASFDDWHWEGMQGDETDSILTQKKTDVFNQSVQKCLTARNRYTVGEAFSQGLKELMPGLMERRTDIDPENLTFLLIDLSLFIILPLICLISTIRSMRSLRDKAGSVRCPTDQGNVLEDTCEYCSGVYVHGIHTRCPHCGAPIKAAESI